MNAVCKLAAILAADVAGHSRVMGADEEGTLERLKARRRELLHPKIPGAPWTHPWVRPGDNTSGEAPLWSVVR